MAQATPLAPQPSNNASNNEYTAKDIQVLGGREAVRRRPGMYIGSTDQHGLHHLVCEIVYNSVDEAMAGCCNRISATIQEDDSVRVEDNGRGIPVDLHPTTHKSALETVFTTLHAGAKFGGKVYQVSGGLHGVGASVVNALSEWLRVNVKRDGKLHQIEFRRGVPQGEVKVIGPAENTGTIITFLADAQIFGRVSYDFNILSERLREIAYLNKELEISLKDNRKDSEKCFYFDGGIKSLVRHLNRNRTVRHQQPIYLYKTVDSTIVEAALQYNDGFNESVFSFANCINTVDGGSHLTGFRTALTRVLNDYAHKNKLLKDDDPNLIGEDIREGLTAVISVKLAEPQFEGQTKAKLGNPEIKGIVEASVVEGLTQYLEEHPDDARKIIEKCLMSSRAREAARKARDLIIKKSSLDMATLPGKLADCSEKEPSLCELFLVEGESAGGSAKQGRNRGFQAILPLRGKILNVEKATPDKMLAHTEIRAMITALRAGIDDELDLSRLRYHKVILMSDADVDGAHIRTLLLTFFYRHMVKLINNGHLFIAQPPLYRATIGKTEEWIHTDEELKRLLAKKAFDKVSIYSKDGSINLTGLDISKFLDSLKDLYQGLNELESEGIPRELTAFLLKKDESFYHLDFSNKEDVLRLRTWLESFGLTVRSQTSSQKANWLEVDLEGEKRKLDQQLFEKPILHKCFKAYPQVKGLIENKSYIVVKNEKELEKNIPWFKLADVMGKISEKSGVTLQRYKGLGEMSAEQLWQTTMNPETRTLLCVTIEDAARADHVFTTLMGNEVLPRKNFIQAHAANVKNLDI